MDESDDHFAMGHLSLPVSLQNSPRASVKPIPRSYVSLPGSPAGSRPASPNHERRRRGEVRLNRKMAPPPLAMKAPEPDGLIHYTRPAKLTIRSSKKSYDVDIAECFRDRVIAAELRTADPISAHRALHNAASLAGKIVIVERVQILSMGLAVQVLRIRGWGSNSAAVASDMKYGAHAHTCSHMRIDAKKLWLCSGARASRAVGRRSTWRLRVGWRWWLSTRTPRRA